MYGTTFFQITPRIATESSLQALTIVKNRFSGLDLSKSPAGIVFLATPHRGASSASLAAMGTNLMKALQLGKPTTKSARELKEFSTSVQDIHSDYIDISRQYQVVSFFELKGYSRLGLVR